MAAVPSTCIRVGETVSPAFHVAWNVPMDRIAAVQEAHQRLMRITGLHPDLLICGAKDINASAADTKPQQIRVFTGLLLATDSKDELAAVLAHEFAHLSLAHRAKKEQQAREAIRQGSAIYAADVASGASTGRANVDALRTFLESVTSFSRAAEREADDKGVKLATQAGYDPGGARAFAERLLKMGLPPNEGYLATHPGLGERAWYSGRLAANENFRDKAVKALNAGDARQLAKTVAEWKAQAPDSGGAAYYGAFAAIMLRRPASEVSAELEDAVSYFGIDQDSLMGQEYSTEALDAAVSLCVALHREGKVYPALNCIKRLPPPAIREFRKLTGWDGFLILGRSREAFSGSVFGASAGAGIMISTCGRVAAERGLRPTAPWSALRPPKMTSVAQKEPKESGPMACDPTLCDCKPTTLKDVVVPE
jgi:hypothetical protein